MLQKRLTQILNKKVFFFIILFFFSIYINFYYGYKGIFPIDSFLIFDSGYYVLNGKYPFKDFWVITGPVLDFIQSVFFSIFGVKWFSYVLHASFFNLILVLFSYFFFINIGLNKFYSFVYSLGVAILGYPVTGTPFPDVHSYIFALFATYSFILAITKKSFFYWLLIPIFLILSFLSKQTSSFYLTIYFSFIFLIYLYFTKENKINIFLYILSSLIFSLLFIFLIFKISGIPLKDFFIQYFFYPYTIGQERISNLNLDFKNVFAQFKFIHFFLFPLIIVLIHLIFQKTKKIKEKNDIFLLLLFSGSAIIFIYSQLLTQNQILIFSLIPISGAILHSYVDKYYYKKYLIYLILALFIFSTGKYHIRFNENKKFMELHGVDLKKSVDAKVLDDRLKKLNWITSNFSTNPQAEVMLLKNIKEIIINDKKNKILITDYQFLSSFTENKFVSPNKWYDSRSVPSINNKYYEYYKDFFISRLNKNKIQNVYIIGNEKNIFLLYLINEKDCVKRDNINNLLSVYDIKECDEFK